jgi:hypothetical protein
VPTAHTTDLGFCIHDYTMSPCQLHMDCIHCEDLICVKGDKEKMQRLRQRLEEARELHTHALQAVGEGYAGSDRWLEHHHSTVERLTQLCSIMDDPTVPVGAVVQLSAPGTQQIEDGTRKQLSTTESGELPSGLLADVMSAMGE